MMTKKAIVIGGGPLGLSASSRLIECGYTVTIIERNDRLLGLADTFKYKNQDVEKFYHFFYKNDSNNSVVFLDKYKEDQVNIKWKDISTDSYINGERYNFDSFLDILKLVKLDIFKIILAILKIKLFKPNIKMDGISAIDWSIRTFGVRFSELVWIPLLEQKFGEKSNKISALWLITRISRHMSTKNNLTGKSRFGYLIDTYTPYVNNLEREIVDNGGSILTKTSINEIVIKDKKVVNIMTDKGDIDTRDTIVFSTISLATLKNIKGLTSDFKYLNKFNNIGVITVVLFLNSKLSNDYWTTITDSSIPFFAVLQQNRLYKKMDEEIVYLSQYYELSDELLKLTEGRIYEKWIIGLKKIYPWLEDKDIEYYRVFRSNAAAPIPFRGIINSLPRYKTVCSNFYHAGFEHISPEDRGVGNSILLGRELVDEFIGATI
jgi:protoporphyrinogen oxidase